MEETKIIYHVDDEETPYLVKIPVPPDQIRLIDFKNVLNRPNYKFFFKSMDDDFGEVKEEIVDDDAHLPCFNGRAISWLVSREGSNVSDSNSQTGAGELSMPLDKIGRPLPRGLRALSKPEDTETESVISSRRGYGMKLLPSKATSAHNHRHLSEKKYNRFNYDSSILSSDLDTTTFFESEDDASSRITATTDHSSVSRVIRHNNLMRRQKRRKHKPIAMSRTSSFSSITDSTMSLNIITVNLNMSLDDNNPNFLGISIVGESNKGGDGGIYVGSIMKGGAVAKDGRIEPGDMILQVNDVNFENMTNDEAVRVLRDVVSKRGPIKLVVAKCWDPNPKGYFTIPRTEPVRPIDPGAWVAHTTAAISGANAAGMSTSGNNDFTLNRAPSISTLSSGSITSSVAETERTVEENGPIRLTTLTPMSIIVREMQKPDSGLEIRDRNWLKITIPNAFIGADIVDWLLSHVEGFADRREAKKYASNLLKSNYIRHTVNKITFSEQCYYVFDNNILQLPPISNLTLNASEHCSQLPLYTPCYDIYSYPTNQQLSESNSSGRSVQLLVDGMSNIDSRSNHSSGAGGHRNNGSNIGRGEVGSNGEVFVDVM
ncbi:unnamed protein product [Allacma fusca]|uniref:Dishevelled n=1 Tax=Allacma fusca TaxID=39272 RepID=A0A8J2K2H5_9HEXA|nr:unnamed protein product [Allacma fusca]